MSSAAKVQDHMQHKPVIVHPDMSIFEAMHTILDNKISGACVVEQGKVVGMLSELDCLQAILSKTYYEGGEGSSGTVRQFMVADVDSVRPDDDIYVVANEMFLKRQRRRPVIENGELVGLLTCRQILQAVKDFSLPIEDSD